jgi:hypothetical protein
MTIPAVSFVATRGKHGVRTPAEYRRHRDGPSFERRPILVSDDAVDDRGRVLYAIETASTGSNAGSTPRSGASRRR